MRGYSVAAAALALDINPKWVDNLLSQNRVAGVAQSRQGIPRRLSPGALLVIATVHALNRDLQVPVATALGLAHRLWDSDRDPRPDDLTVIELGVVGLQIRRGAIRTRVEAALAEALEMAPRTRRGRPRRKSSA